MYSHRAGVVTMYLFENTSKDGTLNETIALSLDNQMAAWSDEIDETLIGSTSDLSVKSTLVHQIQFKLEPGQSKLLLLRPLSADGASSKMARNCSISVNISDEEFRSLCKSQGQVCFAVCLSISRKFNYAFS